MNLNQNTRLILFRYLKLLANILSQLNLESYIKGIGVPGLNRNDVYQLEIPFPSIEQQRSLSAEIQKLEQTIAEAQAIIAAAPAQKQAIMQNYL